MTKTNTIKNFPLVSVIIPLFNYEQYVADCIDSIAKQDYENIEIILIDNASTDNGLRIARDRLASCGVSHKVIENDQNIGICASLNRALQAVNGDYTCIISSDDLLAQGRISRHIKILESPINKDISACNGPIKVMKEDATPTSKLRFVGNLTNNKKFSFESIVKKTDCPTLQGCTFVTNVLKDLLFDENLFYDDWDFFIRLSLNNYVIFHDKSVAAHYRIHDAGLNRKSIKMIESRNQIREKYYKSIKIKDHQLANAFDFTISFWNLMGLSYQGFFLIWNFAFFKLLIKNPLATIKKFKDIAWSFKNLILIKFKIKIKN
jgi:alpha-1,3-rhamnosyltransferase